MTGQRALMMGARVLSVISRPYYMPVVGFLALFTFTYLSLLPLFYKLLVLSMVWIFTIALPRLCVFVWRKLNGWAPMQLRLRERRAVPYVMFMLSYTACLHLMFRLHLPHYMCGILVAALLVQAVCIVVNIWWKISMHCAGAGAIIGALLAYSVLFSGAVGTARMLLRQHSLAQVVTGTLVGTACGLAGILLT